MTHTFVKHTIRNVYKIPSRVFSPYAYIRYPYVQACTRYAHEADLNTKPHLPAVSSAFSIMLGLGTETIDFTTISFPASPASCVPLFASGSEILLVVIQTELSSYPMATYRVNFTPKTSRRQQTSLLENIDTTGNRGQTGEAFFGRSYPLSTLFTGPQVISISDRIKPHLCDIARQHLKQIPRGRQKGANIDVQMRPPVPNIGYYQIDL